MLNTTGEIGLARVCRLFTCLMAPLLSSSAIAAEGLSTKFCRELDRFHDAKFDDAERPQGRRWVEMHWVGFWLDLDRGWGLKCVSSPDAAAGRYCHWLEKNTSFEFPALLPKAIFKCAGHWREPDWQDSTNSVSMLRHKRLLQLELNLTQTDTGSGVLRLSSFAKGKDEAAVPLPPLMDEN